MAFLDEFLRWFFTRHFILSIKSIQNANRKSKEKSYLKYNNTKNVKLLFRKRKLINFCANKKKTHNRIVSFVEINREMQTYYFKMRKEIEFFSFNEKRLPNQTASTFVHLHSSFRTRTAHNIHMHTNQI